MTTIHNLGDRTGATLALRDAIRADLIAVDGDPLAGLSVLQQVSYVMKDGREFTGDAG